MKNYLIEGIPGAGKSTLLNRSYRERQYHAYREGDYTPLGLAWCAYMDGEQYHALLRKYAEMADEIRRWTVQEDDAYVVAYTRILTDIPGFHKDMEQYEIYHGRMERKAFEALLLQRYSRWNGRKDLFEGALFQNVLETMILFYCRTDEEILAFYRELYCKMQEKDFVLLYLEVADIGACLERLRKERRDAGGAEMWFPLMQRFLEDSPYGRSHGLQGQEGLLRYWQRRVNLEYRIMDEIFREKVCRVPAYGYDRPQTEQ